MFDLDAFLADCVAALDEDTPMLAVKDLVARAVFDPDAMTKALPQKGVTIMLQQPDLTVASVVVPAGLPLSASVPHNHLMWAVVGVYGGQEDNRFFRRSDTTLEESGGRSLQIGDALAMGDDTIHAIHNPLDREALAALHVYGGDLPGAQRSMWADPGLTEQPYDDKVVVGRGGFRRPGD
jgi:predicted metal-dependent enzyme (double-stranded beta helix superfamily)